MKFKLLVLSILFFSLSISSYAQKSKFSCINNSLCNLICNPNFDEPNSCGTGPTYIETTTSGGCLVPGWRAFYGNPDFTSNNTQVSFGMSTSPLFYTIEMLTTNVDLSKSKPYLLSYFSNTTSSSFLDDDAHIALNLHHFEEKNAQNRNQIQVLS